MTHLARFSMGMLRPSVLVLVSASLISFSMAQTTKNRGGAAEEEPVFHEYRGVQIGWLADDVRKKLGSPADKGEEQDFYVFGDKETAQVFYDKATRQVTAISVDFMSGAQEVITPQQVFGGDVEARADGSKAKLVRYP